MLLIRLYPFVYCDFKENKVLFFDTLNKRIECFQFYENVYMENKLSFVVNDNSINREVASKIDEDHWGKVDKIVSDKTKLLKNSSTELYNYYNVFFSKKTDNKYISKALIKKLNINLTNKISLFFYVINETKNESMSSKVFTLVYNSLSYFENLEIIELNADSISLNKNSDILRKLKNKCCSLIVNIPLLDFKSHKKEILSICEDATINVLIDNLSDISLTDILILKSCPPSVFFKIQIKNTTEYSLLETLNLKGDQQLKVTVNPNCCVNDLNELLSYDVTDIIGMPITIDNLIHKEFINSLYCGDLFVDINGDILCNDNQVIGNFINIDDVQYHRLIGQDSLWKMTRNKYSYCCKCLFRNICPPLSRVEFYNKRIFCKMIFDKSYYDMIK